MQTAPSPTIRLRLLGRADLIGPTDMDPGPVLGRPKLLGLLCYLAAALPRGFRRRDTLLGLFWSEMDQDRARGALRQSLYHLRRCLGEQTIIGRGDEEVALAVEGLDCDVALFEATIARGEREDALEIYRGDLLEGFRLSGAPMFERWLAQRRDELRQQARSAAWALALHTRAAGELAAAAGWARRALQLAADDEGILRQVIGLLDGVGDRAGAVREYEGFAKRLREDLDLEPAPQTRALIEDIRARGPGSAAPVPPVATSIAVMPFLNMTADPEDEYLSDGLAEEVTNALTKVKSLRVAARTSAFAYKGRNVDARRIGRELGVTTLLEGSVRKAGGHLRITAQLIKAEDGYHLWSERFDRDAEDIFAIQDEIAQSIVRVLEVLLTEKESRAIVQAPTSHLEAYEYYLRGRHLLHRFQKHSVRQAREMFERAIAIDPDYALAYAGVADCSSFLYMYFDGSVANLTRADEASRRVLELQPQLAEAHAARGLAVALGGRYEEAEREFERAIALDPAGFDSYYFYGRTCLEQGKFGRALELLEHACEIREDYQARVLAAQAYEGLGRSPRAARAKYARALDVIGEHHAIQPGDARALTLGAVCLARLGHPMEALDWCERALAIDPDDAVVVYTVACTEAVLGHHRQALDRLERAINLGDANMLWIRNDPDFVSLRDDPRFRALVGLS